MSKDVEVLETEEKDQDSAADESTEVDSSHVAADEKKSGEEGTQLRLSVTVRSLVVALVIAVMAGAIGVLSWLYVGARHDLDTVNRQARDSTHAEQVALDYATNAAAMDFHDMNAWKDKLVAGTSPELKDRLTKAATSMEQLLVPLEWSSTAQPLVAKARPEAGGIYVVDAFVSVLTKTTQAPDGLQSTATYSITIDSNNNWQITDVAGISGVVERK